MTRTTAAEASASPLRSSEEGDACRMCLSSDQSGRPGRPRSARAEHAILEATLDLLAESGPERVTIEQVANRAGVAKTTIYRRWNHKNSLMIDAMKHLKGPLPQPPGHSVRGDLIHMLTTARDSKSGRANKIMPRLFALIDENPDFVQACREQIIRPRRDIGLRILQRGIDEGLIRPDIDLELLGDIVFSPIIGCTISRSHQYTDEEITEIVDVVLKGVAV